MITLEKLIDVVSEELKINLRENSRRRDVIVARAIYYQLAFKDLRISSSTQVGKALGKDHATVLHGIKTVIPMLDMYYPRVAESYRLLKRQFDVRSKNMTIEDKYYDLLIKYNKLLDIYGNDIQEHKRDLNSVSQESRLRLVSYTDWKKQGTDTVYKERKGQIIKEQLKARVTRNMLLGNVQQAKR